MKPVRFLALVAVIVAAGIASAQTLYKLVDKNGKVTYAEKVPPGYDGKATRIDVDPNANTMVAPKGGGSTPKGSEGGETSFQAEMRARAEKRKIAQARVEEARLTLEQAKKALEDARANPDEGDLDWQANQDKTKKPGDPASPAAPGPSNPLKSSGPTAPAIGYSGSLGPRKGGGARSVQSQAYIEKLAQLEAEVKKAEEALAKAEYDAR